MLWNLSFDSNRHQVLVKAMRGSYYRLQILNWGTFEMSRLGAVQQGHRKIHTRHQSPLSSPHITAPGSQNVRTLWRMSGLHLLHPHTLAQHFTKSQNENSKTSTLKKITVAIPFILCCLQSLSSSTPFWTRALGMPTPTPFAGAASSFTPKEVHMAIPVHVHRWCLQRNSPAV